MRLGFDTAIIFRPKTRFDPVVMVNLRLGRRLATMAANLLENKFLPCGSIVTYIHPRHQVNI